MTTIDLNDSVELVIVRTKSGHLVPTIGGKLIKGCTHVKSEGDASGSYVSLVFPGISVQFTTEADLDAAKLN